MNTEILLTPWSQTIGIDNSEKLNSYSYSVSGITCKLDAFNFETQERQFSSLMTPYSLHGKEGLFNICCFKTYQRAFISRVSAIHAVLHTYSLMLFRLCYPVGSCVTLEYRNRVTGTWIVKPKADLSAACPTDTAISDIPSTHFNQESRPRQYKNQSCSQNRTATSNASPWVFSKMRRVCWVALNCSYQNVQVSQ